MGSLSDTSVFLLLGVVLQCALLHVAVGAGRPLGTTLALEIMHRDHPLSPMRPPSNCSDSCRTHEMLKRSVARISHLESKAAMLAQQRRRMKHGNALSFSSSTLPTNDTPDHTTSPGRRRPLQQIVPSAITTSTYLQDAVVAEFTTGFWFGSATSSSNYGQFITLVIDMASELLWVQCIPVTGSVLPNCASFDRAAEINLTYYIPQTGDDGFCDAIQADDNLSNNVSEGYCLYHVSYNDNSMSKGFCIMDHITLGQGWGGSTNTLPPIGFGCGFDNYLTTFSFGSCGVLGLASKPGISFRDQLGELNLGIGTSFMYCLPRVNSGTTAPLMFGPGGFPDPTDGWGPVTYTPMMPGGQGGWFYIGLKDFGFSANNDDLVGIPDGTFAIDYEDGDGGAMLDSGAMITSMPATAYQMLRDAWQQRMGPILGAPIAGVNTQYGMDLCWNVNGVNVDDLQLPSLYMVTQDLNNLLLHRQSTFIVFTSPDDGQTTLFCFPFVASTYDPPLTILSGWFQQGTQWVFDTDNLQIGWRSNYCP